MTESDFREFCLTLTAFAALVGKSVGWVSKQLDLGMPGDRAGQGAKVSIPVLAALLWLAARAEQQEAERPDSQRDRLARVQADKVELETAARRGELVPAAAMQAAGDELIVRLGSALDGVPGRLANELAGIADPAEIRARIGDEIRVARVAFSDGIARMVGGRGPAPAVVAGRAAGAKAKPRAVGGRKPRASAGKRGAGKLPKQPDAVLHPDR